MISDFIGGSKPDPRKPKRIEPLEKEPQRSLNELVAEHEATENLLPSDATTPENSDPTNNTEPAFVPPDEVIDTHEPVSETSVGPKNEGFSNVKRRTSKFLAWRWPLSKKWTVIAAVIATILIGGGAAAAYYLTRPDIKGGVSKSAKGKYVPKDTRVPSTLSGLPVDASVNQRPVIGVMIENSEDARPQSGLNQASVVFEAIAEGGITRFLALFQDTQPDYLGPVRSARPYYVQWCMSFDCALAHAGGSPEALQNISEWGTKDLNDAPGYFTRISSRYAPHNLYSSLGKLSEYASSRGYNTPNFTGFARKKEQPYKTPAPTAPSKAPASAQDSRKAATSIDFAISSGLFNSHFDYDANANSYHRSQAGAPHTVVDANGNQTDISPKVVVAMIMSYGVASDKHSQYGVVASGQAYIFQDGTVTEATWNKSDTKAPLIFKDAAGKNVPLNPGQTWLTALAGTNLVTYQ